MRHRLDNNHKAIRTAAEHMGWYWADLSQSAVGVDALLAKGGRCVLVEVKDGAKPPSARPLTPHEVQVHEALRAHGVRVELLTCIDDLLVLEARPSDAGGRMTNVAGPRHGVTPSQGVCVFCKQVVAHRKRSRLLLKHPIWVSGRYLACPGSGCYATPIANAK